MVGSNNSCYFGWLDVVSMLLCLIVGVYQLVSCRRRKVVDKVHSCGVVQLVMVLMESLTICMVGL